MAQTYNSILGYIKRNLGAKVNLLEMTDDEIIDGIKEDVIPYFSQYIPDSKYVLITDANREPSQIGYGLYRYTIPLSPNTYVIDILDAYQLQSNSVMDDYGYLVINSTDLIDVAISNKLQDIAKYLSTYQTWEFIPPNIIQFDLAIGPGSIVNYCINHLDLDTILPDYFETVFKPLCLAFVKKWLSALRSKYSNLSTPFGQIEMNWDKLDAEWKEEFTELEQKLLRSPFDHYIHIC